MRRTLAAIGMTTALCGLAAAPAHAAVLDRDHWSNSFSETIDDCGITGVDHTWDGRGVFILRAVKGTDDAFLASNSFHITETFTNPDNDRSFSISTQSSFRETSATHVDGTIWLFTSKSSGASFTVQDSAGKVVHRDSGTIRESYLFDTLGDGQPGGVELSREVTALNGRFTALDFCSDVMDPLLG